MKGALGAPFSVCQYVEGSFLWIINNIYFQYFSLIIFIVCVIVMIVVSYLTEEPSMDKIGGLTFATTTSEDRFESRASWDKRDVISSCLVLGLILLAYLYFSG